MISWSGKRDSNSRPQPWQGCALPTELFPRTLQILFGFVRLAKVGVFDSLGQGCALPTELFRKICFDIKKDNHKSNCLILSGKRDSNSRPQPWQGCALPTELFPHCLEPLIGYFPIASAKVVTFLKTPKFFMFFLRFFEPKRIFCPIVARNHRFSQPLCRIP